MHRRQDRNHRTRTRTLTRTRTFTLTLTLTLTLTRHGGAGLPDGTIRVALTGHTGQSFGFTLMKGVRFDVHGDANDGCGKVRVRVRVRVRG